MILTLTVNPALDRNLSVDRLAFEDRAYILNSEEATGGRGINASQVIQSFGGKTVAVAPIGGATGDRLAQYFSKAAFTVDTVRVGAQTRTNLNISDAQGLTIKLNEKGEPLTSAEQAAIEKAIVKRLPEARWLMLCGSLPPGVPADFYARLIEIARKHNVKTLLDTDGEPLEFGIEARPTAISPNQHEAERLLNKILLTRIQFLEAADRIRMMGPEMVVLSVGAKGALGAREGMIIEAVPPRVDAVSPIGAGDALAASFVWAMENNGDFGEALRWGVAAGTASAMLPGLHFANMDQTRKIYDNVQLRENAR